MRIFAAADHGGFELKQAMVAKLRAAGHDVVDLGTESSESVDYPAYAHAVARAVSHREAERGLLCCGTGLGVCMTANRHAGVRAADCLTPEMAEITRKHNDCNVLCLGGRLLGVDEAWAITQTWLATPFEGGRHERRIIQIDELDLEPGAVT